jgi:O-methyltransferase involved in polyketide biosynthesis
MTTREKITLTREQETLLIPLFAKAQPNPMLDDVKARQILDGVEYDFARLKVPKKTAVTLRIRAKQLDSYTQQFLAKHPNGLVLHLGCGLDSRCARVPHPAALWVDLDFPDVIELRRKFYPESESYRLIASSVTDLAWLEQVDPAGRPVFVVAEGLLMYLTEAQVRALILALHSKFPGAGMVFDAFSLMTAKRIKHHPSLRKTGASVYWGTDDPREIERWAPDGGIRLVEEWTFGQSPDIDKLDGFYRFMFRLTAKIKAAQQAQRLLYFQL